MDLLRHLTLLTMQFNIYLHAAHIPGKQNDIADAISRFQFQRFRHLAPEADINPHPLPDILMTSGVDKGGGGQGGLSPPQ